MSKQVIGQVSIYPRGEFQLNVKYEILDVVHFKGNGYICIKPCEYKLPTNTEFWMKLVDKGDKGDPADKVVLDELIFYKELFKKVMLEKGFITEDDLYGHDKSDDDYDGSDSDSDSSDSPLRSFYGDWD